MRPPGVTAEPLATTQIVCWVRLEAPRLECFESLRDLGGGLVLPFVLLLELLILALLHFSEDDCGITSLVPKCRPPYFKDKTNFWPRRNPREDMACASVAFDRATA